MCPPSSTARGGGSSSSLPIIATPSSPSLSTSTDPPSLATALDKVLQCFAVDRVMAGMELLYALEARLAREGEGEEAEEVQTRMQEPEMAARLELIRLRGLQCKELLTSAETTEGWTLVSEHGGTATYFQPVSSSSSSSSSSKTPVLIEAGMEEEHGLDSKHLIRVRLEGEVACSPMEQLAAMREAGQYQQWMPLCQQSALLHREGNADQVLWWSMGVPGLFMWDILLHAWGADCMLEDGSVVIVGGSILTSDKIKAADLPPPPKGWASWRISLHQFRIRFKVTSPNTSQITVSFVLDPKLRAKVRHGRMEQRATRRFPFCFLSCFLPTAHNNTL